MKTAPAKKKPKAKPKEPLPELDSEAWRKFESLVKSAAKMGHKPHSGKPKRGGTDTGNG